MAVKIRLRKLGHTHNAFYRVIVSDSRTARNGRFIEEVGTYNPYTKPSELKVDAEKINTWIKNGAKPTDTVARLLKANGITK